MNITHIIFADKEGTTRAPMAAEIFKSYKGDFAGKVEARGLFVSFPEPINQKAEAVMISDGIDLKDFSSSKLTNEDIKDGTLILTADAGLKGAIIDRIERANEENTYTLSEYAQEELDVMDPYGGTLQAYGICYESLKNIIKKLIEKM